MPTYADLVDWAGAENVVRADPVDIAGCLDRTRSDHATAAPQSAAGRPSSHHNSFPPRPKRSSPSG
ncbi:hypothetical protein ACFWA5_21350 [Streptomyces mirabilis]|uniref:hypothetical protein n=1 Tax=Streptomyces mirabilis TaxID=68239 RepID=UPI00364BE604